MAYSLQCFLDTANRRILEAKALLSVPKKHCDGAVTYALLSTECALKATLLYGSLANDDADIADPIHARVFRSRTGHDLAVLWHEQPASIQSLADAKVHTAIQFLHSLNRYEHRYGLRKPLKLHATPAVEAGETVIAWMNETIIP